MRSMSWKHRRDLTDRTEDSRPNNPALWVTHAARSRMLVNQHGTTVGGYNLTRVCWDAYASVGMLTVTPDRQIGG